MARYDVLWSPTAGLFAVALSILIFAALMPARYQFAASSFAGGQVVWRGDTTTGRAILCGTDDLVNALQSQDAKQGFVRKC